MRIALVTTVKDEAALLAANLRYHHWLGVERAWVFVDGSTDGTAETVAHLPFVELARSARPEAVPAEIRDAPRVRELIARRDGFHTLRQMLDMAVAAHDARRAGFDWIVGLDPDELIAPDPARVEPGMLTEAVARIGPSVESLQMMPLELIPRAETQEGLPFERARLFKNLFRAERGRLRPVHAFPRKATLPGVAQNWDCPPYLGQSGGKSLRRLSVDAFPKTVHRWRTPSGAPLRSAPVPWLHHYCNASFESFRNRYRMRPTFPAVYPGGAPVNDWDLAWYRMVHDPAVSEAEMRAYYAANLIVADAEIAAWRAAAPDSVVEVTSIRNAFRSLSIAC